MASEWEPFQFLLGEWEGGNEEDPRQGQGNFSFSYALNQNILVRRSRTVFPETLERGGFTHDDLLIIYIEFTGLKRAIYFDNEGHVIHYEVNLTPDGNTILLESDLAPSAPRFRFTYTRTGADKLNARFEIAPPNEPDAYSIYLDGTARRVRQK